MIKLRILRRYVGGGMTGEYEDTLQFAFYSDLIDSAYRKVVWQDVPIEWEIGHKEMYEAALKEEKFV